MYEWRIAIACALCMLTALRSTSSDMSVSGQLDVPIAMRGLLARQRIAAAMAVVVGAAFTLVLGGYQFGRGNHDVYLLDAMRRVSPELLANDWFTTQTLQYHAIFGVVSAGLWRAGVIQPAFFVGFVLTLLAFHLAWLRIVRALGGDVSTYLLSVLLYELSAGGTGLGMYQFIQDGSFLPSNVANVAMLWGFYFWITRRDAWAGAMLGIAGLVHLNHAIVGIGMWGTLGAWRMWRDGWRIDRAFIIGTIACIGACAANIVYALIARPGGGAARSSLAEFVDLYVRLRHPHHYDPSSWPIGLWIAFLWSIPFVAERIAKPQASDQTAWREARRVVVILVALTIVSLVGAGIWYVSETLVQLSFYRFSIYVQLIGCIGAAFFFRRLNERAKRALTLSSIVILSAAMIAIIVVPQLKIARQPAIIGFVALMLFGAIRLSVGRVPAWLDPCACVAIVALAIIAWPRGWLGLHVTPEDDPGYVALCDWAADLAHTDIDAVFLVPPAEQSFRLHARRAIVVNFKGVPQLSGELPAWRNRLEDVLGVSDLREIPRGWPQTFPYLRNRYESRSPQDLLDVAKRYGARYVVVGHSLGAEYQRELIFGHENANWFLYDLTHEK